MFSEKVEEIPFDKYFFNFADPKVLHAMTDGTEKGLNLWKTSYGFDHAFWLTNDNGSLSMEKCYTHCLKADYEKQGSFSSECKRKKGFFKCCINA